MKIYDDERELVKKRMEEIKENKRTATGNRKITIAAGEPVLKEDADEYKALNRMAEILEFGMHQISDWEYLDLREQTSLEALPPELRNYFKNPKNMTDTNEEKDKRDEPQQNNTQSNDEHDYSQNQTSTEMSPFIQPILANNGEVGMAPYTSNPNEDIEPEVLTGNVIGEPPKSQRKPKDPKEDAIDVDFEEIHDDEQINTANNNNGPVADNENLVEVVKTTPWQWIKNHKKQILIALGLSALTLTVIIAITQLLPALVAASEAAQVAGLSSEMLRNGAMWFSASASEKLALHGANTALANVITSLTGVTNSFNTVTGAWTLGTQGLSQFAAASAVAATDAAAKVSLLTNISLATGIGGLGTIGAGLLAPKKKSAEYKAIKKAIDNLVIAAPTMTREDQTKTAQMISNKIIASTTLSESERSILFRKLQKALKKIKNKGIQTEITVPEQSPALENNENNELAIPQEVPSEDYESIAILNPEIIDGAIRAKTM